MHEWPERPSSRQPKASPWGKSTDTLGNNDIALGIWERRATISSRWIKTLSPQYEQFAWQGGYAAFSVSQSQVETVIEYIKTQMEHHKKQTFQDEYLEFLRLHKIEFDERYVLSD